VEQVQARLRGLKMSVENLIIRLEEMVDNGTTYCKKQEGGHTYANMPFDGSGGHGVINPLCDSNWPWNAVYLDFLASDVVRLSKSRPTIVTPLKAF
jgi:hypothetical protein